MHIFVLGAGGIGSYLIPLLQRHLSKTDTITVMDGDVFEKKNMSRQLFSRRLLGVNKAKAMFEMYPSMDFFPEIKYIEKYLVNPSEVSDYSEECGVPIDVIISCPDNHAARRRCLDAADNLCVPAVVCGNESESSSAILYLPQNKGTKADPRIAYPSMLVDTDRDPTHACTGVAQEENKQLAVANFISAGFAVGLVYKAVISPVEDKYKKLLPFEVSWTSWGLEKTESIQDKLKD